MTKAQQKALEKAKTRNFTRKQMDFLQDESHYAWAYTFFASYFTYVNKNYSNNITLLDNSVDMLDKFCTECPNDHIAKEYAWAYLRSPECTIYIFSCIYKERIILEYFLGFIKADTKQSDLLHILEQIEAKTPEDDFDDVGWHEVCSSDDEQFSTRDIIAIYAYIYRYCFFEDSIPMERIDTFLSELTPATLLSLYKDWKSCSSVAFWIANFIKNNVPVEEAIAYHWDINAYNAMQGRKNREKLGIFTTAYPEEKWKDGPPIYHMPNESTLLELQKYRIDMIVSCVAYSLRVKWLDYGVMFTFRTYKSVAIASDKIYPKEESKSLMILLTYDGALLRESPRIKKFIPLSVKDLAKYYSSDNILLDRFLNTLEQYYLDCGKPFIKDVMPYLKGKDFFLPIALKDLMEYTSFHHAFNEKYPVGKNWNTNDINWLYMLHSISPYISDLDLRRLKNMS